MDSDNILEQFLCESIEQGSIMLQCSSSESVVRFPSKNLLDHGDFVTISLSKDIVSKRSDVIWTEQEYRNFYRQGVLVQKMKERGFESKVINSCKKLLKDEQDNKLVYERIKEKKKYFNKFIVIMDSKAHKFDNKSEAEIYITKQCRGKNFLYAFVEHTSPRGGTGQGRKNYGCTIL